MKLKCKTCGVEFNGRKERKFCSRECYSESLKGEKPELRTLEKRKCLGCNKTFHPRNHKRKYCSNECYKNSRLQKRIINCEYCGKEFKRHNASRRFCSEKCKGEWNTGPNNSTYKGYVTTNEGYLRYSKSHPKYADEYVHRVIWFNHNDTTKCNRCDGPVEHIHHIDRNKRNNHIENLEGLCATCHETEHAHENQFWKYRKALI